MIVAYSVDRCPGCRRFVDAHFFLVSSGLGPPRFACSKCGREFNSGRLVWPQMMSGRRFRYFVVSLVYAGVVGLLVTLAAVVVIGALAGRDRITPTLSQAAL